MDNNNGTIALSSASTIAERCEAASTRTNALSEYSLMNNGKIRTAMKAWRDRKNALRDEDYRGICDALGYDMTAFEAVIADEEQELSKGCESEWADTLKTILEGFKDDEKLEQAAGDMGYVNAFLPFLAYVQSRLGAHMASCGLSMDMPHILEQCMRTFVSRLLAIALKTVILELHVERAAGSLGEGYAKQQLQRFFSLTATRQYRERLYAKYPVMLRFVTQMTNNYVRFVEELIDRIVENQSELRRFMNVDGDFTVDSMAIDQGDVHDQGRTVVMLSISGRPIVYKPRSLAIHVLFVDLVHRFEWTAGFLPMHTSGVLARPEYAFEAFVEHRECQDERQVQRYYTRYGQLLGLIWLLHGDDMHHENIIADGEYPRIIDYETITTNWVPLENTLNEADAAVSTTLRSSLTSTCMLPSRMMLSADGASADISAFDPDKQQVSGVMSAPVKLDSAEAHYEKSDFSLTKDGCVVSSNGRAVNPYHYGKYILQGFRNAVTAAKNISEHEWRDLLSRDDVKARVLIRNTDAYARFMDFAHHPSVLSNMLDVEAVLENLYVYPFRDKRIFASEYRQMLAGDVPMFTMGLTERDLHAPDGSTIDGICDRSIRERVLDTVDHIDEQAALQVRIIYNALQMAPDSNALYPGNDVPSDFDIGRYPYDFGGKLIHGAELGEPDGTISWFTANASDIMLADKTVDEQYTPGLPSSGLYDGLVGAGVLFGELFRQTRDDRWRDAGTRIMRSLTLRKDKSNTYSGFTGKLSRTYCALRLNEAGIMTSETRRNMIQAVRTIPDYADVLLPKILKREKPQPSFHLDYLTGAGSAIMLYTRLYEKLRDGQILEQVSRLGKFIITAFPGTQDGKQGDEMPYPSGAAHGLEGMTVAFWKLYALTMNQLFGDFAHKLWSISEASRASIADDDAAKWCRGRVGVLWAQNELESITGPNDERFFGDDVTRPFPDHSSVSALLEDAIWDDDSVCHGRCGAIDTLISAGNVTGDGWYFDQARMLMDDLVKRSGRQGLFQLRPPAEFVDLSYCTGRVGVAYTMLRVRNPKIPSILALEVR